MPDAHIAWLSHPMGRQLLEGHPALNAIHYHPVFKSWRWRAALKQPLHFLGTWVKHVAAELKFIRDIRKQNFDIVVDSICTPRTALLTRLSGARLRSGIRTRWNRNWAYNRLCATAEWANLYAAQARLDLLKPILGEHCATQPSLHWLKPWIPSSPSIVARIESLLNEFGLNHRPFILLSPTHRRELRRWPADSYAALALELIKQKNVTIVWMWGPGEDAFVREIHNTLLTLLNAEHLDQALSVFPPLLTLAEVAALAGRCQLWIGNSNGLSHVAVAGGAATVQIHGPTASAPWTHPDTTRHTAVQRTEGCLRCERNVCALGTHECMMKLSVESVLSAALKLT
jgi:ADP-heptose:LPS heptosyltransferase